MALYFVLFLALAKATFGNDVGEVTFVSELSSKPAQKLSKYDWYGNARLQKFHIPDDTAIASWVFTVVKGHSFHCRERNVSIHIRHGAPPVINPTDTAFPNMTLWNPPYSLLLPVTSLSSATLNVSYPAPGEWFVATHLPENDGRIEQKGFPSCSYFFQPQLSIRRAIDTPIIQSGIKLKNQTAAPNKPARLKLYVPQFSSSLSVSVDGCSTAEAAGSANCSLALSLGSNSLLRNPARVNCYGLRCSASLANPPWDTWLRVVVESIRDNQTVFFNIESNYSVACKPKSVGLSADDGAGLRGNNNSSSSASNSSAVAIEGVAFGDQSRLLNLLPSACVWSIPVLYDETDVLSLRFAPVTGPNVSVRASHPTLLTYPLPAQVTGGTLNLQLTLNTTYITPGNSSTVVACFTPLAPILQVSNSLQCHTDLFEGYGVNVSTSFPKALIRLPFPLSATWYLTLQLKCDGGCGNVSTVYVDPKVFVNACIEDCGSFGECRLLRSSTYLYSSCVCKSGWRGWSCTDHSTALSSTHQVVAALLLTLSNLSFLPVISLAIRRFYFTEASVYLFTMFFSTFYHACDQPGIAALCIMSYDTLQYCDFLGSVCSIWVTVLCMARIGKTVKYTLFLLGTLLIAMSLQLDRRGLWNLLGPILSAIIIMAAVWVYRGVTRRQCYPPSWRRWVFYLIPGILCALIGVSLYIFAETEDNYFYTHSIWHILVASCVLFLLPPRDRSLADGNWTAGWRPDWTWRWTPRICGYTLCQSSKDDTTSQHHVTLTR
ncbi:post-GPI attachment to proteins factor 6 [Hippocampus comes]|uniref:Post-glycosylphosphatidylinositol attachment to proteins 6 n=1 Tax=Hippocampus comes TaxID=109280 RepID=A0A3Q2XMD6_HIPCM|nr:PREDICTED: transmembrane protein 8B-like [Hippocampus comes]